MLARDGGHRSRCRAAVQFRKAASNIDARDVAQNLSRASQLGLQRRALVKLGAPLGPDLLRLSADRLDLCAVRVALRGDLRESDSQRLDEERVGGEFLAGRVALRDRRSGLVTCGLKLTT